MQQRLELPSYLDQESAVVERFKRIYARPAVLEASHVGRKFEGRNGTIQALGDINFKVYRREFVCVIGSSGCGKSTLIRILAGLDQPTNGQILLDGKAVSGPGPDRGMVFQGYTLFPWLSVLRNVMFGPISRGTSPSKAEADAMQWVKMVGLEKFADAYPHQLSGGMRQRVAIARSLANHPRILLMDEPFGALDAQTRCQMQTYLQQIWMNIDVTILFITHDLDEAVLLADRIIVLGPNPGHIQEIIEVPLLQPRTSDLFVDPRFIATRKRIDDLIHPKSEQAHERLPIPRMTVVGDDVL